MTTVHQSTTTPSEAEVGCVNCVRKDCIADPRDPYHQEPHLCFSCGAQWYVTPGLLENNLCPECNWIKCPACGACKCSLTRASQKWVDRVRSTYCQSIEKLAAYQEKDLPIVDDREGAVVRLKAGLGLQLMFCNRWARVELRRREAHYGLTILGSRVARPISAEELECFPTPGVASVALVCEEVSTLCPVTGQPDFVTVSIVYSPHKLCIETKSLKLYLWSFRDKGIFAEALAVEILGALVTVVQPHAMEVEVEYQSRGGILLSATAESVRAPF